MPSPIPLIPSEVEGCRARVGRSARCLDFARHERVFWAWHRERVSELVVVIGIEHYVVVSSILFVLGVLGIFLNRKNVIVILMAIELILLAVNINFVAFSAFLHDLVGQVFAMFVLTVAAAEAAIGLAILVIYFRGRGSIAVDDVNRMRG